MGQGKISPAQVTANMIFGYIGIRGGWPGAVISLSYEAGKIYGLSKW